MRILHTSDWHLGRPLEGRSRQPEQEQFIDEICRIADEQQVHMVLIVGDIFDTYNPPAWAEQLFCAALERLANGGRRAVVVIAGNHDSPERLNAVRPLAQSQGIILMGVPQETVELAGRVKTVASGAGWVEVAVPSCEHSAVLALLPYPSESRLGKQFSEHLEEYSLRDAYSEVVHELFKLQTANYRSDTVNLALSHLFVQGSLSSESERPIEVGGACTVAIEHLPANAQYIALGHLHRPQQVKRAPAPTYYSGSPLAYSFSEANQSKAVYLVDVEPGQEAQVEAIPLTAGIPLRRWVCTSGLEEVWQRIDAAKGKPAWVDLEVHAPDWLSPEQVAQLREAWPWLVNVRTVLPSQAESERVERLSSLTLPEIFNRFYKQRRDGATPPPELVELFVALANQAATQDEGEVGK